ncbi:class II aldolase/adducin family protein [Microbacterium lushaniae]|uniref:Aldolase n=1 Tax=Microbacterium lushaniae TaxID=2614639 RepID=A0A5J6L063_9MICO|nr:class II aldolase/adducin family protein [Microbacterium lushaniae]QEW01894.1 aldolase [Microbacterium lushaniae]
MRSAERLVDACHALAAAGLSPGRSGNVSVREGDRVLITATGAALRRLGPEHVAVLSLDGAHLSGPAPTKEWALHMGAYRVRPDAGAIVHLHSRAATALSCLPVAAGSDPLPAYTPYRIRMLGRVALIAYAAPGSDDLARAVAAAAASAHALLLANHGSLVCGSDLEHAVDLAEEFEAAAELVLALHGRGARVLDPATAWR